MELNDEQDTVLKELPVLERRQTRQREAGRPVLEGGAQVPRDPLEAAGLGEGRSWVPTVLMSSEPGFHKLAYKTRVYPLIEQFPT